MTVSKWHTPTRAELQRAYDEAERTDDGWPFIFQELDRLNVEKRRFVASFLQRRGCYTEAEVCDTLLDAIDAAHVVCS